VATARLPPAKKLGSKRITLMTIGSRGDVQPLVALGKVCRHRDGPTATGERC